MLRTRLGGISTGRSCRLVRCSLSADRVLLGPRHSSTSPRPGHAISDQRNTWPPRRTWHPACWRAGREVLVKVMDWLNTKHLTHSTVTETDRLSESACQSEFVTPLIILWYRPAVLFLATSDACCWAQKTFNFFTKKREAIWCLNRTVAEEIPKPICRPTQFVNQLCLFLLQSKTTFTLIIALSLASF